jgi:hypothetical protein
MKILVMQFGLPTCYFLVLMYKTNNVHHPDTEAQVLAFGVVTTTRNATERTVLCSPTLCFCESKLGPQIYFNPTFTHITSLLSVVADLFVRYLLTLIQPSIVAGIE